MVREGWYIFTVIITVTRVRSDREIEEFARTRTEKLIESNVMHMTLVVRRADLANTFPRT